ncbi:MAG TPA: family 78 glycoside hydrolase catalytic domain [Ruminiclostridium sp.]
MIKVIKIRCEYKENPIGIDVLYPRISWQLKSDVRSTVQSAYRLQVSKDENFVSNVVWDTEKVESEQSIHLEYKGITLESKERYYYRVQAWDNKGNTSDWSETCFWEMGILTINEWTAQWIMSKEDLDIAKAGPCPMLRKAFEVSRKVKAAKIYATSLGLYELYINGSRIGDCLFTPGWTSYKKRLQYQVYDVTEQIKENKNAIGVVLGDGWYRGYLAWAERRNTYGEKLAALIQLHIKYEDGSEEIITSDKDWKASNGPIVMSDLYMGETYDARLEKDGWSLPEYCDDDWNSVDILEHTKEILIAQENVPVRVINEIKPIELLATPEGDTILDMGQNMVGWLRIKIKAPAGTVITLQHAEVLDKSGNFYTENLRSAKQTIRYITSGIGEEIYEPHFSFQGFRYIRITGYPMRLNLDDFTGRVIHSDMEPTGSFTCSDELVNQLQHNIQWGQKGNFLDVPTDCPQRDERLGWTGDAQVFIRTACYNMNVAPFFTKWLRDLKSDQTKEKGVPFVIPQVLEETSYSSSAWGDAAVICPWTIYLCYGDKRLLEEQYESMKDWVEYIRAQGDNEFLWNTGFHFGDWLGLDAKEGDYVGATARDFIATAFYAYSTQLLKKTAEIIKNDADVKEYNNLYNKIIENFRKEFVSPNGRLVVPTQTAHVLALMFDLVEKKDRKLVAKTLAGYLEESKVHLTTGFVGTPYLCDVLTESGYLDLSYKLLLQKDYPSWLYPITKGATTIWEHWDGIKEDGSFWSKDMNSFNHYAYGAIGDWMYSVMAGIDLDPEKPGYKHINIKPQPGQGITFATGKLESMFGEIKSAWVKNAEGMETNINIPSNTTATVVLPAANVVAVFEGENSLEAVEGVSNVEQLESGVKFELGSGEYCFKYKL